MQASLAIQAKHVLLLEKFHIPKAHLPPIDTSGYEDAGKQAMIDICLFFWGLQA